MTLLGFQFVILATLVFLSTAALAQNIGEISLPECGIDCYRASCNSTTDMACTCSNTGFNHIFMCLSEACTTSTDYYTSFRKLYQDCHVPRPIWTVDPDYISAAVIVFVFQSLFFGLRMISRMMKVGKWGWDDITCVAAYITLVAQLILCTLLGYHGLYIHYWSLDFWKFPPVFKIDFARAQLYAVGLGLCKMSIIFLYQRIFDGPRLRRVLLGTQIFNALLTLSYFLTAFFVYMPFNCGFDFEAPSSCTFNDVWDRSGAYSAVNAAFDIWLVSIPAFVVWRLQMKTERKISVIAVFATGIMTCMVAILRVILYRLQADPNLSEHQYQLHIWLSYYAYYAELTSCFVISCLPAVRQLVGKKFWPVLKSSLNALSSTWSRSRSERSAAHASSKGATRTTISSPLEGSFRHLTSHLEAEDSRNSFDSTGAVRSK